MQAAIWIISSHRCIIEGRIWLGFTRQKVTKSIRKMSVGVIICPDQLSSVVTGRHSRAPTIMADGMATVLTLRCRCSSMCMVFGFFSTIRRRRSGRSCAAALERPWSGPGPGPTEHGAPGRNLTGHTGRPARCLDLPLVRLAVGIGLLSGSLSGFTSRCTGGYDSNSLTLAEISLPSARPASRFDATPITLPISFIDVAPTSAMMAFTSAVSSSAVSCLGRNSS